MSAEFSLYIPCFLAAGCGIDGNLRGGGTTLACLEWCGGLSLEDTVCCFCLTKPPAGTVKEELHLTTAVSVYKLARNLKSSC